MSNELPLSAFTETYFLIIFLCFRIDLVVYFFFVIYFNFFLIFVKFLFNLFFLDLAMLAFSEAPSDCEEDMVFEMFKIYCSGIFPCLLLLGTLSVIE